MTDVDELERLAALRDRGVLSAEEFDRAKAKILDAPVTPQPAEAIPSAAKQKEGMPFIGKAVLVIGGLFGAILIFSVMGRNSGQAEPEAALRGGIALCWKDYERKSLSASDKQFVASTCERMERDYRQKYGREP